jgi:Domain of unknown function (DUF3576)
MRFENCVGVILLASLATGCTALENDLQKGLRHGTDSYRLTKKADAKRKPGQRPKAINAYLWRAAMDTVGFLPLETADPQYGRIETKWYSQPAQPGMRSKMLIEILDPDLRRDTIRVKVERQVQDDMGKWSETPAPAGSAQSLEDSIYTKARDIAPY